jgi:hypothetical protein
LGVILSLSKDLGVTQSSHLIPGIIFMMSLFVSGLAQAVHTTPPVVARLASLDDNESLD